MINNNDDRVEDFLDQYIGNYHLFVCLGEAGLPSVYLGEHLYLNA